MDIATGDVSLCEILDGNSTWRLEELFRILEIYKPKELIVVVEGSDRIKEKVNQAVQNPKRSCYCSPPNSDFSSIQYQNVVLDKLYPNQSTMTPIESLNLELYTFARTSFMYLIQFCHEHYAGCLDKMRKPTVDTKQRLALHNNAIYQLNVFNVSGDPSLFDVVNKTSTGLGKRLLMKQLSNPISQYDKLEEMYERIDKAIPEVEFYETHLKCIGDLERLHRRMSMRNLHPFELQTLVSSYDNCSVLLNHEELLELGCKVVKLKECITSIFALDKCTTSIVDICDNMFTEKHVPSSIQKLDADMKKANNEIKKICDTLSKCLAKNAIVKVEGTHKYGYNICTTSSRAQQIKQTYPNKYEFKTEKSKTIIFNEQINTLFHKLIKCQESIKPQLTEKYLDTIVEIYSNNHNTFLELHEFIANVDVIKSKAKCAKLYNYCRPQLINSEEGFIQCHKLKHAIIERIDCDTIYIPNDVAIDNVTNGILMYGVNGSGKSCYSKAIGLAIILAQSGHYVPAEHMSLGLFTRLYTRISDADNMYKGQSSFFVEMTELKSIVHYADSKSIVLGDEVCKGTEDVSALAIVATSIEWLLSQRVKFIFATHLHKLPSMIAHQDRLIVQHMAVHCDDKNGDITFTRKIDDGMGDTLYGIEIAKMIIQKQEFFDKAYKLRNDLLNNSKEFVKTKKSRYNSNIYMDKCHIKGCNSKEGLESHHITFQSSKAADSINVHGTGNIAVLCKEHHSAVHKGTLIIYGWCSTSRGRVLQYEHVSTQ